MISRFAMVLGALLALGGLAVLFPLWWQTPPTTALIDASGYSRATQPRLTGWTDARLRRRFGEDDLAFATRLTQVVHRATYHCEANASRQSLAASLAASRAPETASYGYLDPSIMRCGYCHQRAFILAEALRRGGLTDAQAYGLNGHVVTLFGSGGRNYFTDADYGVGPAIYAGNTYSAMPRALYDQWGDDISRAILASAFAEPADDGPYMSHEWLMTLALRQGDEVRAVERRLDIIGWSVFVGGLLLFFGPLVLRGPLRWR